MLRIRTTLAAARADVKDLAYLDAAGDQCVPGGLDVGNDQVYLA
jgi:hypothetical protein